MEDMIISFFETYGWQLGLAALSGILILGILKYFNTFSKIEKSKRKYIYAAISAILSAIASAIYLWATGTFNWASFGILIPILWALNQTAYTAYENWGIRSMFKWIGNFIVSVVAKNKVETAVEKLEQEKIVEQNNVSNQDKITE